MYQKYSFLDDSLAGFPKYQKIELLVFRKLDNFRELRIIVPASEICLWLAFIDSCEETGVDLQSTWF